MTPDRIQIAHPQGGYFSALRWADTTEKRPLLLFSHATGFNAATYTPLFEMLSEHMDIVAPDSRGHGHSTLAAQPTQLRSWKQYYSDLAHLVDQLAKPSGRPLILAGHSIGGLCSLAVAASRPHQVSGVVPIDPVMLDPTQGIPFRMLQLIGRSDRFPLAAGAKRRRAQFASTQEAYSTYRQKRSFSTWPDAWLQAYVDGAFAPTSDGNVQLRCAPAWECRTFSMGECWPWRFIASVKAPVSLLVAQRDSTCSIRSRRKAAALHPHWNIIEMEGTTHFLPMEKTVDTARHITELAGKCKNW